MSPFLLYDVPFSSSFLPFLPVSAGDNSLRLGIAAVAARVENGTLKVLAGACPNLLREASLYRYSEDPTDRRSETPLDAHNHALAALRYMVTKIDARQLARMAKKASGETGDEGEDKQKKPEKKWLSYRNEALWTRLDSSNYRIQEPEEDLLMKAAFVYAALLALQDLAPTPQETSPMPLQAEAF